jgi:phage terminase large subunit-like protein
LARSRGELAAFERFCSALAVEDGSPMRLEPFQRSMLRDYFDGVRETLIILPKKNGKTTLLAALALYHLMSTVDAACVVGATSREQASELYQQATGFIDRSPGLQQRLVAKVGYREIRSRRDRGRVRVLAADADTADGVIPTLALVDELHRAKSTALYGVFRDGLGPRNGQMLTISTAGEHEASPLGQMRAAAHRLPSKRQGRYLYARSDDRTFALHEWALERDDDTRDLEVVKQVNPASWQTLELLAERRDSPSTRPSQWLRFACGIWISGEDWWIKPADWELGEQTDALEFGDRIAVGFDGSRFGDATALVACRLEDALLQPLGIWEKPDGRGEWEVPAGQVDATLALAMDDYRVVRGYFDPPLWQSEIDGWAREYGDEVVLRYHTKRSRMMDAVERFRTDQAAGRILHTGDETLTRHVLNAQMREVRGGYWLEKSRTGTAGNIDGAVASVLAYEARCDALLAGDQSSRSKVPVSL